MALTLKLNTFSGLTKNSVFVSAEVDYTDPSDVVLERGFEISNYGRITLGSGFGNFSTTITGLTENSFYSIIPYAINGSGFYRYADYSRDFIATDQTESRYNYYTWHSEAPAYKFQIYDVDSIFSYRYGFPTHYIKKDGTLWYVDDDTALTQIGSDNDWEHIEGSVENFYIFKGNGDIYVCGSTNTFGSFGLGNNDTSLADGTTFHYFGDSSEWKSIKTETYYSIGLKHDGSVWVWGGLSDFSRNTPYKVSGNDTYIYIDKPQFRSNGFTHSALRNDGRIYVMDYDDSSLSLNLDYGTVFPTNTIKISGSPVSAAYIALTDDNKCYIVGSNENYVTGLGINTGTTTTAVLLAEDVIDVGLSKWWFNGYYINTNKELYTWGDGELNGHAETKEVPTKLLDDKITSEVFDMSTYIGVSVFNLLAPIDLFATPVNYNRFTLNWTNSETEFIDNNIIEIYSGGTWNDIATVSSGSTSYEITGLEPETQYEVRVSAYYDGATSASESIFVTTLDAPLKVVLFCELENPYTVTPAQCTEAIGSIEINNKDYLFYYDFILTDIDGTVLTHEDGLYKNLKAGYYFLRALAKPQFWNMYGRDNCLFEWIKVEDEDTDIVLNNVLVRPAQCSGFDIQEGRVTYALEEGEYEVSFYLEDRTLLKSLTGTTNISYVGSECLYGVVEDLVSGCKLLVDKICVPEVDSRSIGGVKKLFIAEYVDDLDFNYWSTADEDFYLEEEDVGFFLSTKIKEYTNDLQWYSIPLHNGQIELSQSLDKVRQGWIFTDTITVAIAKQTSLNLLNLLDILNKRWVYVLQDANNNWWTGGYEVGAELTTAQPQTGRRNTTNQINMIFTAISSDNILTAIDEEYVKTNIL